MDIIWHDKIANMRSAEKFIRASSADIVILPEMFTTGFATGSDSPAEEPEGETYRWMVNTARDTGRAITGSYVVGGRNGKMINRLLFVTPEGKVYRYDKRHLFSFGGEDRYFERGTERLIFEYKGFRIMPLICYDLRFPVWSRSAGECDLIIYVASWAESRVGVWDTLLRARAIENQCYVAGVNRVGIDPTASYPGHSYVIDYFGQVIASAKDDAEELVSAYLDLKELDRYREKFRAWRDADEFTLII